MKMVRVPEADGQFEVVDVDVPEPSPGLVRELPAAVDFLCTAWSATGTQRATRRRRARRCPLRARYRRYGYALAGRAALRLRNGHELAEEGARDRGI